MPTGKGKKGKEAPASSHLMTGSYIFPNGDRYEGEYEKRGPGHIVRSGQGTHTTASGTVYSGQWTSDTLNGRGEICHPTGASYKGDIVDGQCHGKGMYQWPDGSSFTGPFSHNRMDGRGGFTDSAGRQWMGDVSGKTADRLRLRLE